MKEITKYFCRKDFAEVAGYATPVAKENVAVPAFAQDGYAFVADANGNVVAYWL